MRTQTANYDLSDRIIAHLEKYKALPEEERREVARKHLIGAGILDENGEYTEPYRIGSEV